MFCTCLSALMKQIIIFVSNLFLKSIHLLATFFLLLQRTCELVSSNSRDTLFLISARKASYSPFKYFMMAMISTKVTSLTKPTHCECAFINHISNTFLVDSAKKMCLCVCRKVTLIPCDTLKHSVWNIASALWVVSHLSTKIEEENKW